MKNKWKFKPNSRSEELSWCRRNLISLVGINQVAELVKELTARLARFNIRPLRKLIHRYNHEEYKLFCYPPVLILYRKSGNFRCINIFVVDDSYEN